MGLCLSGGGSGRRCADAATTAKLVLQDGRLEEFSYPVKVSHVLQYYDLSSACFICNSDEMDFDDAVCAVDTDEVLQPGQLYFALPLNWLERPLQAQEMAALAVKANSALMKSGRCRRNLVCPVMFPDDREVKSNEDSVEGGGSGGCASRRRKKGSKFATMLTSIPE